MALSFGESLKIANEKLENEKQVVETIPAIAQVPMSAKLEPETLEEDNVAAYAEDVVFDERYKILPEYSDNKLSTVDENKLITLDRRQINVSQESNSQYIPFEMPRRYDGFDLAGTTIRIYFVNAENKGSYAPVCNVSYTPDKIRFAWVLNELATAKAGKLKFEIHAIGHTTSGEKYVLKTRPNETMNVLESLSYDSIVKPDDSWITDFLTQVEEKVHDAQVFADQAGAYVEEAKKIFDEANEALDEVQGVIDDAKGELAESVQDAVNEKVEDALADYYTQYEIDQMFDDFDTSDQLEGIQDQIDSLDGLAKFNVEYDGSVITFYNGVPGQEGTTVIKTIKVPSDELLDDIAGIHETIDDLPETLKTDYYNKTDADAKFATLAGLGTTNSNLSAMASSVDANKQNVALLSEKVVGLESLVGGIDTSPRKTYDATYDEENIYTLWEIENEGDGDAEVRTAKSQFKIQGGGGGGGTSSVLKIEYITTSPIVATVEDKVVIKYSFSGVDSSGDAVTDGAATWRVGGTVVANNTAIAGENSFDVTDFLSVGTQKVNLSIVDDAGSLVTKTWTVQKVDVRLTSSFNDKFTYPMDKVSFDYTPYGAIAKTVHFKLDGVEIGTVNTSVSGIPMAYELPVQTHGAHLLEVYMTAEINGNSIESNHIVKDIIWYDSNSDIPVISCVNQNFVARQYDATNIEYAVYDPKTETPEVVLAVDGEVVSTLKLDSNVNTWQYKSVDVGEHVLTITCGQTVKTLHVTVEKLDIELEPVTAGLVFDFNPAGKSNNDADRLWSYEDIKMSVSDNFDWVNGGYQLDENGDQYFCIKAGTSAEINYNLFADDAKRNGKEFKLVFKTTNVRKSDASFLNCIDGTTSKVGVQMNVHEAYIHAGSEELYLPYSEEDVIEFEFNISKNTDEIPMIMGYEDGVATRPLVYGEGHSFTQNNPKFIAIGSNDCDVYIYRFKVYNAGLTDRGILNNFIADARNAEEMIARYKRNQIYDENSQLTPEILAERCPDLRIIKIDAPWFTNDKKDKVTGTTVQMIYKNGDPILDNWTCYNGMHAGQGTSSNEYGAAGRNLDLIMNKSGIDGVDPYIVLGDGVTRTDKVSLTRNSVPNAYFNVKVNIASSENANNALLARRYNEFNPYVRPAKKNNPMVKDTMQFENCVVFIRENNPDTSTHREFNDCEWHFYSIGNVGDSKKTDKTRVNDKSDPLECVLEIMDYNLPLSEFPGGEEALAILDADQFDEEGTYGWRYRVESDDPIEDVTIVETINEKWREFYRFVVNSTDEEFHNNLGNYFVVDSALFYYLFTERYTMVDNRAKNSFWHYGKNEDGVYRWDLTFCYDNDTSFGISNTGKLEIPYGKEDIDHYVEGDDTSPYIYRAAESTFFCRLRDLFKTEMQQMFVQCESQGAWSASGLINQFDNHQAQFPEELWRVDIVRKYIRTYKEGATRFLPEMANGRKKYQRRQFERNQEMYMATKYFGTTATSNQIMMRFNNPVNPVIPQDFTLYITPYANMYISVKYGNVNPTNFRAKAGVEYTIPYGIESDTADITLIYGASFIQGIGDLSKCYVGDNDFSKATRLQKLVIGSDIEGYANPYMTNLKFGNNKLLKYLDVQNVTGLSSIIDLSSCGNMEELYAYGSGATGIVFANGGKIHTAELPAIGSAVMKNLAYLTDLNVASFDNLHTLTIENCSTVDAKSILEQSPNVNRVRIIGVDWNLEDTSLLKRIYNMYGKDNNGYDIQQSVLSGVIHVPVIKQQELREYEEAWADAQIIANTIIAQYAVTFVNYDGTVLDVQYVDKGGRAVDPITRADNPIPIPTKESTVSTDFTYDSWDTPLTTTVMQELTIMALYSESVRKYTIKYMVDNIVMQESVAPYGDNVVYTGEIPTYTKEESAYKYYLFNRWDKSGFIDGDKIVNAVFDKFEYNKGSLTGKQLKDLRPVELYAVTKIGIDKITDMDIQEGDEYSFEFGYDIDYDDIESEVIVADKLVLNGSNHVDTGIKLFDEDKDFTLAIDYKMAKDNALNAVLVSASSGAVNNNNGFKLLNRGNGNVGIMWGNSSAVATREDCREMIVIRHKKGDNNLYVYNSNINSGNATMVKLDKVQSTINNSTLVLGCMTPEENAYENYAVGEVNWCKVWHQDLGNEACMNLVCWTHEKLTMEICSFKKYYLSDNPSKRCSFTMLATHLLEQNKSHTINPNNTNVGGWAKSKLNEFLNTRLYNAAPVQMKQVMKRVIVASSVGGMSNDISYSDCYISVPAAIEVDNTKNKEPFIYEGETISYMINNEMRKRSYAGGDYAKYWLRSPDIQYTSYFYYVQEDGTLYQYTAPYTDMGVLVQISF